MKYILTGFVFMAFLLSGCSKSNDPIPADPPVEIVKINVEPILSNLDVGTSERYKAIAIDANGTVSDVTDQVTWSLKNNSSILEFDATDTSFAKAVKVGADNITATLGELSSTGTRVTVGDMLLTELTVTPKDTNLAEGTQQIYTAQGSSF